MKGSKVMADNHSNKRIDQMHENQENSQGRQTGGGVGGGSQPPLNFGWGGVEHLLTPPDFEKKNFSGGWLPLNWSNYIVYVFLSI